MGDLIKTTAELEAACETFRTDGVLALDTEFVWRSTYRPQLGIVQAGGRSLCRALDCLTGMNPAPLRELLEDASIVKILHDARQDLVLLRYWTGVLPRRIFDTQLAAAFAGFPKGIGLQKLLFDVCDVGLPKTETCTDWMQRPLSDAQVRYALDDVRYLPSLRDVLLVRLDELGTRAWFEEDSLRYDDGYAEAESDELWKRIRLGRVRLDGRGRAVLRAVAVRREELAQKMNLPRNWLGDDDALAEMASTGRVGRMNHRLKGGQADTVRALYAETIEAAKAIPEEDWPEDPRRHYIREVLDAADAALDWLREKAETLHVDAAVIANRATVTAFVDDVGDETNPLASGWRYETVGAEMADKFGVD